MPEPTERFAVIRYYVSGTARRNTSRGLSWSSYLRHLREEV